MDIKTLRKLLVNEPASRDAGQSADSGGSNDFAPLPGGLNLDLERERRTGIAEVVFGPGKSHEQLVGAVGGLAHGTGSALVTKLTPEQGAGLAQAFPNGVFHEVSGLFCLGRDLGLGGPWPEAGQAMVVTAGASDLPVALEAFGSARFFGLDCGLVTDAGIAGLHRLTPHMDALYRAGVVVAVAGMDGALPGVLAGLVPGPVVAVPTSTGYGASLGGISALLTMLNTCSPGISVVNIDNGFGAAAVAARILSGTRHPAGEVRRP